MYHNKAKKKSTKGVWKGGRLTLRVQTIEKKHQGMLYGWSIFWNGPDGLIRFPTGDIPIKANWMYTAVENKWGALSSVWICLIWVEPKFTTESWEMKCGPQGFRINVMVSGELFKEPENGDDMH